jgi:hypothetical protein
MKQPRCGEFGLLVQMYQTKDLEGVKRAWKVLKEEGRVSVSVTTQLDDEDSFFSEKEGTLSTFYELYIDDGIAHSWRLDWRGRFAVGPAGDSDWIEIVNEYADDFGGAYGFQENGEMYELLDFLGIYGGGCPTVPRPPS